MTAPNDLREAYTGQKRGPQAGFASGLREKVFANIPLSGNFMCSNKECAKPMKKSVLEKKQIPQLSLIHI